MKPELQHFIEAVLTISINVYSSYLSSTSDCEFFNDQVNIMIHDDDDD